MKKPLRHIQLGAIILGLTVIVAVVGYRFLFGHSWIDAIYMIVITVSTVGYAEASGLAPGQQLFTVAVILLGMSAAAFTIGGFLQMLTEGEIQRALGQRRLTHEIEKLSEHIVVCGYGRIGQILASELERKKRPFLVIDNDPANVAEANLRGHLALLGDATQEETLILARVEHALTLVSALPSDADNVFIALTARSLNDKLQILARAEQPSTQKKLLSAGANKVVMPTAIGARQLAWFITRPSSADLMELVADRETLDVELDEIDVEPGSELAGQTVAEAKLRRRFQLLLVAIKLADGHIKFSPGAEDCISDGDTLIVMGRVEDIEEFRAAHGA